MDDSPKRTLKRLVWACAIYESVNLLKADLTNVIANNMAEASKSRVLPVVCDGRLLMDAHIYHHTEVRIQLLP